MKIVKIQAEMVAPPNLDRLRVTLIADSGQTGSAEAGLTGRAPAITGRLSELVKSLIGRDPFDTEALIDRHLTHASGRLGDVEVVAVSMLEMACRDLVGQALGLPVYRLLGGSVRDRVAACAVAWMPAHRTAEAVSNAAGGLVARGFRALAVDPFGPVAASLDPSPTAMREAVRLAEVVRAAVGPEVALRIDIKARLGTASAGRLVRALERVDPVAVADPVRAEHLPFATGFAVAAGEGLNLRDDFFSLLARRGSDLIRLDLTRCGGYTEARKIAALAESHGVPVSLRNLSGPAATSAGLHLAATLANLAYIEVEPYAEMTLIEGAIPLSDAPGIGPTRNNVVAVGDS